MNIEEYRRRGKEMVDYIADYLENIRDRRVFPNVKPGYMRNLLPDSAPLEGEEWQHIFLDVERVIMPGITHWQSPHMHAYFPATNSFPSLLGDMLADAVNCLGFTWASSPACTELETIVMSWLGKMIGLPDVFLHTNSASKGGGVIQTTASEATLVCLLAGRTQAIRRFHEHTPGLSDAEINARLVAYCSDQAHSSVEKAALIGLVRMRYIESDDNLCLRGDALREAIVNDTKLGLIPFWVCATLGTTGGCSFDNLDEVGSVCLDFKLWLHVDAAYAGSAFICPEYRRWLKGIEKADSIAFNPSKWLLVHFDCTALWVKNSGALHRTFNVEPLYLQHENSGLAIDYMHWQIPLSKRFRSLKLWFVIRNYGIKGLQKHIREGVRLAQKFEALVLADNRFEIPYARHLGMVVFRIKGDNDLTEKLLKRLNHRGNLHCVPASLKGKYVIRFTVTSIRTTNDDIIKDWAEIRLVTTEILKELNIRIADRAKVPLKDTREKNEAFGSSLLLANSPMSPKIVNGSFAAIFDADEFLAKAYAGIRATNQNSPAMRRRVRGILMSGKQFSLDSRMDLYGIDTNTLSQEDSANGMIEENKSINEDVEDAWEAYEPFAHLTRICAVKRSKRSQSTDAVVPVHNRNCSNKSSASCYTEKMFSLSSYKNCERNCPSSDRPYRRRSFNSSLHSIDETDTLDFQRSRKRELSTYNAYPEKRLSDPLLHCAFINKGFDVELNRRQFSMFDTFSPDYRQSNAYPIPKVKVRISDECGNRIDNSFDSQSDSIVDDCWNFGTAKTRNDCQYGDAFSIVCDEGVSRQPVKKCGKCGHRKPLETQFSTTFS
ncbi:histidine decarboxylase isoform X1 [Bradysia coprophila]|uniref:histidine decarboxylase isoform X1 n=1 Tax=Bradysia coprophila TaxID=38358 RepID=UPI00187DB1B2|nr:histidine decarboxylase isoform X1 [Bradysia coprophila]